MNIKYSLIVKEIIHEMRVGSAIVYNKKRNFASLPNKKVVGITFRALLHHELITKESETEKESLYTLTDKGRTFNFSEKKCKQLPLIDNDENVDLSIILQRKLREEKLCLDLHTKSAELHKKMVDFHRKRVKYLSIFLEKNIIYE